MASNATPTSTTAATVATASCADQTLSEPSALQARPVLRSTTAEAGTIPSTSKPGYGPSWMTAPQFIIRLFTKFPLATFEANALPCNTVDVSDDVATLFVFAEDRDRLSYNPTCLKWQAYLRFAHLNYTSVPSTNHASPTGSLPFLLPAASRVALPCTDPRSFALPTPHAVPVASSRSTMYMALLDTSLRPAWLHALYIAPENTALLTRLYITPTSASRVVQAASLRTLRRAAETEVHMSVRAAAGHSAVLRPDTLYADARVALAALEAELARSESGWFLSAVEPTVFDAAVFSYVHLLLDESLVWGDDTLPCAVASFMGLVAHRDRVLNEYWPGEERRALKN
ncbi:hypothetical protein HOO65_050612 [Ceratocystis lukuohia]|uniref:Thioredoxin-like fold domain-containing protein n=1 Tax=Ceratocystis lukuohia TaxID=2019550 RepID=A0ABR4MGS5_9PEZI